jgi:hypothetical protein
LIRRRINHKALRVLEFAVGLHLNALAFAVAQVHRNLHLPVRQFRFLNARARDRILHALVEQHDREVIFLVVDIDVLRRVCAGVLGFATGEQRKAG